MSSDLNLNLNLIMIQTYLLLKIPIDTEHISPSENAKSSAWYRLSSFPHLDNPYSSLKT